MSALTRAAIVLALLAGIARAERVEIADPDPELVHAVETALAPWKLEITVVRSAPVDDADARARATAEAARFIVWREGSTLVVYDRERDAAERRPARTGAFDPATAAAAAATIKTMMRLPPPPAEATVIAPPPPPPPAASSHVEVRFDAGLGARISAGGSDTAAGGRVLVAAMVRPSSDLPLRLGVRADLGTDTSVDRSGFSGAWSDWSVLAIGSLALTRGAWELDPWLGGGITRGHLDGTQMATPRSDAATLPAIAAGATLRHRWGSFSAGAGVAVTITPAPPTYTRDNSGMGMGTSEVFEAPGLSVVLAGMIAIDLGR